MTEHWSEWQGREVDGEFRLDEYLGGTERGGVFSTEFRGQKAVLKLQRGEPRHEWGAELSHPHLMRIFRTGRWEADGVPLHYLVMEYGDEVLADVVAGRPLTPDEAREMLAPVLETVNYLHERGFAHGRLKPSNILSAGEHLKISSDGLARLSEGPAGSATDVWALGATLVEVLTQHPPERNAAGEAVVPESIPAEFREIVKGCLDPEPERRWTLEAIAARLASPAPAPPPPAIPEPVPPVSVSPLPEPLTPLRRDTPDEPEAGLWRRYRAVWGAVGLVAVIVAGIKLWPSKPEPQAERAAPPVVVQQEKPPAPATAAPPEPAGRVPGKVVAQVSPSVSRKARESIQGTVKVQVRVHVNPAGHVTEAKLQSRGRSRYFEQAALQAARRWKFAAQKLDGRGVASSWVLDFEFRRSGTEMHAREAS